MGIEDGGVTPSNKKILSSALLVMGAMIGAGMLGMPIAQNGSGFIPCSVVLILSWLYTYCTAVLLLEACTWMPRGANLMTIARHLIGNKAAVFCLILYIIFFYSGLTAHIAVASDAIATLTNGHLSDSVASIAYTSIFATFIYSSLRAADWFNRLLMLGVALLFFLVSLILLPYTNLHLLLKGNWANILPAVSVFLFAFNFQYVIPPLYNYLNCDAQAMKKALRLGTFSTLLLYGVWNFLVLSIVPGQELSATLTLGRSTIASLEQSLQTPFLLAILYEFSVLAVSTSFLGLSLSVFDFWADTVKWSKKGIQGFGLLLLVFVIPLTCSLLSPTAFVTSLILGGALGAVLLYGLIPSLFVWIGRTRHMAPPLLRGGKISLSLIILFSVFTLLIQYFFSIQQLFFLRN